MISIDVADPGLVADVGYAIQLTLGVVFAVSAAPKLRDPGKFVVLVRGYDIAPTFAPLVATVVILAECFIAVSLIAGWLVTAGASVALALTLVFSMVTGVNLRRGRNNDCACFGGESEQISGRSLERLGLIGVGAALLFAGRLTGEVPEISLSSVLDQGFAGVAYLIAALGVAGFFFAASQLILDRKVFLSMVGRPQERTQ